MNRWIFKIVYDPDDPGTIFQLAIGINWIIGLAFGLAVWWIW